METVRLPKDEVARLTRLAEYIRRECERNHIAPGDGQDPDDADEDGILGTLGEGATAWMLGLRGWVPEKHFGKSDVGPLAVRTTRYDSPARLLLRARDRDDQTHVLVSYRHNEFKVYGGCRGKHVKQPRFLRHPQKNRPECYFPHPDQIAEHWLTCDQIRAEFNEWLSGVVANGESTGFQGEVCETHLRQN